MPSLRLLRTRPGAAVAALVWLLGTIVLPVLHLARHTLPHDHEGGGIHYHLDEDAGHAQDDHDDHDDDDEPGGPFTVEAPHNHGHSHHAGGLAHFAAATGEGAGVAVEFVLVDAPRRIPDALTVRYAVFLLDGLRAARAPPAA
ncbi:MAG TPA: hypothetical protein VMV60_01775 [Thermoanaerobaculia bacterium]|nr:hypothetical protein [Thermoanaerobaculia bacterium]